MFSTLVRLFVAAPTPYVETPKVTNHAAYSKLRAQFAILNKGNLFDTKNQPVVASKEPPKKRETKTDASKTASSCDPNGQYQRSSLPLQLKGTVIASDPSYSLAVIYDARRRKRFVVRVGETFFGIKICRVERDKNKGYVKIDRGQGRLEYLELGAAAGRGGGSYRRKLYRHYRKLRNTKLDLSKVRKLGGNRFRISRNFINQMTGRLDILASQAAIVPYFQKGRSVGFRIYNIRKGSVYQKLGIKSGDVIKRINGYEFTSPQKALEAYSNLTSAGNLSVEVMRKGKAKNLSYEVKD
tara:strand:+ start:4260 stop:5150 length:891 start_codon:yes stop_codon:yes gene_type:complete